MSESNGAVRASDRAASVDFFVTPGLTVDDTGLEIFNVLRGYEGTMQERQENGEMVVFCVVVGAGAVYANADAVVRLAEGLEKIEEGSAVPGVHVDLVLSYEDGFRHGFMVIAVYRQFFENDDFVGD
jgi:hypothetical protein